MAQYRIEFQITEIDGRILPFRSGDTEDSELALSAYHSLEDELRADALTVYKDDRLIPFEELEADYEMEHPEDAEAAAADT